jgi:hypothetical protein
LYDTGSVVLGKIRPIGKLCVLARASSLLMECFKEALLGFDVGRRGNRIQPGATADQTRNLDELPVMDKTGRCGRLRHGVTAAEADRHD